MSMTLSEAKAIAFEGAHATVTFDLAERVIRDEGKGRDEMAYAQLAELKAERQRGYYYFEKLARRNGWDYREGNSGVLFRPACPHYAVSWLDACLHDKMFD